MIRSHAAGYILRKACHRRHTLLHNNPRRAATAVEYGLIAGGILLAIILGVTHTGTSLANLFGGMSNSVATASTQTPPVAFAQNCGPAAQTNLSYSYGWSFPAYACGQGGINGPSGTISLIYSYEIGAANSQGSVLPYDLKMPYSESVGTGTLGDMFLDGYSFNAALVTTPRHE